LCGGGQNIKEFPWEFVRSAHSIIVSASFEPIQGPFSTNVRIEPLHDMACVVKRGPPPEWRWTICEFQQGQIFQGNTLNAVEGVRNEMWRGFGMSCGGGWE